MSARGPKAFDSAMCSGSVQAAGNSAPTLSRPEQTAAYRSREMSLPEISRIPSDFPSETLPNDECAPLVAQALADVRGRTEAEMPIHSEEIWPTVHGLMVGSAHNPDPNRTISGEKRGDRAVVYISALSECPDGTAMAHAVAWSHSFGAPLWMVVDCLTIGGHAFTPENIIRLAEDFSALAALLRKEAGLS